MIQGHGMTPKDLGSVYGTPGKKPVTEQENTLMEIIKDLDIPLHKNPDLRRMLMELDSYKNMPKKYYSALSDVLMYAMNIHNRNIEVSPDS